MGTNAPWLDYLARHVGVAEIPGPQHHPLIVEWGRAAGIEWWNNDEDAWCAVAVNGALVNSGFPSTRSALARSFLTYGQELREPVVGAIAVFPRGRNPLYGHVGIIEAVHADGTFTVVNGNVSNQVKRTRFKTASVLPEGLRWPPGSDAPAAGRAVVGAPLGHRALRLGSRGSDVEALQRDLNALNYQLDVDGEYGGRTRDAVRRFARRRGLDDDGVADAPILAALGEAVKARAAADERRRAGRAAAGPVAGAGALATTGACVGMAIDALSQIRSLDDGTVIGGALAVAMALGLCGYFVWRFAIRRAEGPVLDGAL